MVSTRAKASASLSLAGNRDGCSSSQGTKRQIQRKRTASGVAEGQSKAKDRLLASTSASPESSNRLSASRSSEIPKEGSAAVAATAVDAVETKISADTKPSEREEEESEVQGDDDDFLSVASVRSMSYREMQSACKEHGLPANGKTEVLRDRLLSIVNAKSSPIRKQQASTFVSVSKTDILPAPCEDRDAGKLPRPILKAKSSSIRKEKVGTAFPSNRLVFFSNSLEISEGNGYGAVSDNVPSSAHAVVKIHLSELSESSYYGDMYSLMQKTSRSTSSNVMRITFIKQGQDRGRKRRGTNIPAAKLPYHDRFLRYGVPVDVIRSGNCGADCLALGLIYLGAATKGASSPSSLRRTLYEHGESNRKRFEKIPLYYLDGSEDEVAKKWKSDVLDNIYSPGTDYRDCAPSYQYLTSDVIPIFVDRFETSVCVATTIKQGANVDTFSEIITIAATNGNLNPKGGGRNFDRVGEGGNRSDGVSFQISCRSKEIAEKLIGEEAIKEMGKGNNTIEFDTLDKSPLYKKRRMERKRPRPKSAQSVEKIAKKSSRRNALSDSDGDCKRALDYQVENVDCNDI